MILRGRYFTNCNIAFSGSIESENGSRDDIPTVATVRVRCVNRINKSNYQCIAQIVMHLAYVRLTNCSFIDSIISVYTRNLAIF